MTSGCSASAETTTLATDPPRCSAARPSAVARPVASTTTRAPLVLQSIAAGRRFRGMQGHLATITTAAENDFLAKVFQSHGDDALARGEFAWTGGIFDEESGEWKWVDGPEADQVFWPSSDDESFSDWLHPSWLEVPDHGFGRMIWIRLKSKLTGFFESMRTGGSIVSALWISIVLSGYLVISPFLGVI